MSVSVDMCVRVRMSVCLWSPQPRYGRKDNNTDCCVNCSCVKAVVRGCQLNQTLTPTAFALP